MLVRSCLKSGVGKPAVFLHGFLGASTDWLEVTQSLSAPCYACDLPGHGNSPFQPDFFTALYETTRDLAPFHLIGYSMGGRLALQYAARYPVASLTLISAHLGLKESERKKRYDRDCQLAKEILETTIDEFLDRWYDQPLFQTLLLKKDIKTMRRQQDRLGLSQALRAFSVGLQPDFSDSLPKNTSLVVGELDELYRAHYQNLPHRLIARSGHAIHLEEPQALACFLQERL